MKKLILYCLSIILLLILSATIEKKYPQQKFKDSKTMYFQKNNKIIKLKFVNQQKKREK